MRKRIISRQRSKIPYSIRGWLNLEELAEVEVTSEAPTRPIEFALLPNFTSGWRASEPGRQTIRLKFHPPITLHCIKLIFEESETERTQEYQLRWLPDQGESFREIVRQQWNFSPRGGTREVEQHRVELDRLGILELSITPDIGGGPAVASLAQLRLA